MAKAYILWQEDRYLQSCIRCADIVWEKGLLKKGPGKYAQLLYSEINFTVRKLI